MNEIYIVCIEGQGDGSQNFNEYFRPGINLFTNLNIMRESIRKYLCYNHDDVTFDKKNIKSNYIIIDNIIDKGGIVIDEFTWIRIETKSFNPLILANNSSDWELASNICKLPEDIDDQEESSDDEYGYNYEDENDDDDEEDEEYSN